MRPGGPPARPCGRRLPAQGGAPAARQPVHYAPRQHPLADAHPRAGPAQQLYCAAASRAVSPGRAAGTRATSGGPGIVVSCSALCMRAPRPGRSSPSRPSHRQFRAADPPSHLPPFRQVLNLEHNQLGELPACICELPLLQTLNLKDNHITEARRLTRA